MKIKSLFFITKYILQSYALFDMNGKRNPNQVGKDIGYVLVLYPDETNRAVAPNPVDEDLGKKTWSEANSACSGKGLSLPDVEELQSMAYNSLLTQLIDDHYWSGTASRSKAGYAWSVYTHNGDRHWYVTSVNIRVRCVRR